MSGASAGPAERRGARPLLPLALGVVVITLEARLGGWDLYADPVGWLLILGGLVWLLRTEPTFPQRTALPYLGVVAAVLSVPLWLPQGVAWLENAEPALAWAANLPRFGFAALLCHALATAATPSGDERAVGWLRLATVLLVVTMVLPVVALGGGVEAVAGTAGLLAQASLVLVAALLFAYSGRRWAGARTPRPTG